VGADRFAFAEEPREPRWEPPANLVQANAIEFGVGRWRLSYERLIAPHHAFVASPLLQFGPPHSTAFVGEVGYRVYSSPMTLEGGYAGVSVFGSTFSYPAAVCCIPVDAKYHRGWALGTALDLGWKIAWRSGIVLDLGAGVMYQRSMKDYAVEGYDFGTIYEAYVSSGVLPRVSIAVGYAF
jgi:hypothetical protein